MAGARFLVENLFDTVQFTGHTLTAEEEASGKEVERVISARREARDHWTSTTAANATYINVACDQPRGANMMVLDRGHQNIEGVTVELRASYQSAFTTYDAVVSQTIPSKTVYGSRLENGHYVRTSEGAIVVIFPNHVAPYWRLQISATASGTTPQIVGLWLGNSMTLTRTPVGRWDDESAELQFYEATAPGMRATASLKANRRRAQIRIPLQGDAEFDEARYHVRDLYAKGFAMWYVPDTDFAERTWLSMAPPGEYTLPYAGRTSRELPLTLLEHDPARLI